ncbi:MAG: slipin family protein [Desulfotomaculaceae bacterium]|nr:slipin family protein [Desulfotomaculaceae bacterium]
MSYNLFSIIILAVIIFSLITSAIKILPEYERAVLFRLGRLINVRGPGIIFIIPFIDRIIRVSLRVIVFDVPPQEVITKDNVACKVNAVLYYKVVDPDKAIVNVENVHTATNQYAQTTLRSVVGTAELDELLSQREKLNQKVQRIVDEATDPWGIKVTSVEIKDVVLPSEMTRAIARQAEAERSRRAAIIQAEGERQAAEQLAQASEILTGANGGLTLRTLRSLSEVANSSNTTILFPLPIELRKLLSGSDK